MSASTMLFTTTTADEGLRLDVFLSKQLPDLSRSRIQGWLTLQNEKAARHVKSGESISLCIPEIKPSLLTPQDFPLDILYEDEDLLVINKPAGLVVHPGAGNPDNTLVNALLYHYPDLSVGDEQRPGIVHRLDKDTSGVMLIARHDKSHQALSLAFKNREIRKIYRAWCVGTFNQDKFILKTGHKRHPTNRKRFTTKHSTERIAHSAFEILSTREKTSELQIEIFTGRTHQIRAQLADIGHPILGDTLYGGPTIAGFDRHALHAEAIYFSHPISNQPMHFQVAPNFASCLQHGQ